MLIGISGKCGVGKTALANYLQDKYKYKKVSIAGSLKDLAMMIFPFDTIDFQSPKRKESKFDKFDWTPREFLINLGEFLRYHDKDYLLSIALEECTSTLTAAVSGPCNYVIDDVRYPNEAEAIKARGGKIVRVNRFVKDNPFGPPKDIASETSMDDYKFDLVVEDVWNTTLKNLYKQGDLIHDEFGSKAS